MGTGVTPTPLPPEMPLAFFRFASIPAVETARVSTYGISREALNTVIVIRVVSSVLHHITRWIAQRNRLTILSAIRVVRNCFVSQLEITDSVACRNRESSVIARRSALAGQRGYPFRLLTVRDRDASLAMTRHHRSIQTQQEVILTIKSHD